MHENAHGCTGERQEPTGLSAAPGREPNSTEVLLYAFLVVSDGAISDKDADRWAKAVLDQRESARQHAGAWQRHLREHAVDGWENINNVPGLFSFLDDRVDRSLGDPTLDWIGEAIQRWDRNVALGSRQLRGHLTRAKGSSKSGKPYRWRMWCRRSCAWTIIHIAELVSERGQELRAALDHRDLGVHCPPTKDALIAEQQQLIAAQAAEISRLQTELEKMTAIAFKARDAWRKAGERAGTLKQAKRDAVLAARTAERERFEKRLEAAKAGHRSRLAAHQAALKRRLDEASSRADSEAEAVFKQRLSKARARARAVEWRARQSQARLKRAEEAEQRAEAMANTIDGLQEELRAAEAPSTAETVQASRRDEHGRFQAESWQLRALRWAQLARRTPTAAVSANINDVLHLFAPEAVVAQPIERTTRTLRGELTVAGEAMAAWRLAKARRIISFGFDESTKFGLGLMSTNAQIEPHDAPGTSVDVVPRGATLTAGGTAAEISSSIELKIFQHSRSLLVGWRERHENRFGSGSWAADGGPDPSQVGIHRLAEHALLMSDTCNAARAAKRMLASLAEAAARERIGEEAWEAMSDEERDAKCKAYLGDCHGHLRNIIVKAMADAATSHLKVALEDDLSEFSSFDRMSVDGMDLIRAIYKEIHPSGEYAKGKGREFEAWRKARHAADMWMPVEHAAGSRQDMAFDGAVPLFVNRKIILDFLHGLVAVPGSDNTLEKFLWTVLRSNEITALLRVCTLWREIISAPMRWLTGKASSALADWSNVSSNDVLDLTYDAMVSIAADGHSLLDPLLDPYAPIAAKQPAFKDWRDERAAHVMKAPDGTAHCIYARALAEARSPEGKGNAQVSASHPPPPAVMLP